MRVKESTLIQEVFKYLFFSPTRFSTMTALERQQKAYIFALNDSIGPSTVCCIEAIQGLKMTEELFEYYRKCHCKMWELTENLVFSYA